MKLLTRGKTQKVSAAKSGMTVKTARKYQKLGKLPSELKKPHTWKTHKDAFSEVWPDIEELLTDSPRLQALTVLTYLQKKYPGQFAKNQLRTLQRRFRDWRALNGEERPVMFCQKHEPGHQSQSDYTRMHELDITIGGEPFDHLLFHFMLVYSRWEAVSICYSESFDSLVNGYEEAVWKLGAVVAEHRTDNLSAAIKANGNREAFTDRWRQVMNHYRVTPSTNNPGESHENGSIEKSNDLLKKAIDQQLMLRGSRDFKDIAAYQRFLDQLIDRRNQVRQHALSEERSYLKALPQDRWYSPKVYPVKVDAMSTVHIERVPYSVPSRLRGYSLRARIYPDKIELYYGRMRIQAMEKLAKGYHVDYRHIISQLIKKPGAFERYRYQDSLFPRVCFREAFDQLKSKYPATGHKRYLRVLYLAKIYGEHRVATALTSLLSAKKLPTESAIKAHFNDTIEKPAVHINEPDLTVYDELRQEAVQ